MSQLPWIALAIGLMSWVGHQMIRASRRAEGRKRLPPRHPRDPSALFPLLEQFGRNSNAFLTTYPGLEYFRSAEPGRDGYIAFLETRDAWVAASEPVAAENDQIPLLEEFARAAASIGKRVLMIPVDLPLAERAARAGFGALLIGSEPTFCLEAYPPGGGDWSDTVPVARQFAGKGAQVRAFTAAELAPEQRELLERMTDEWLGTRKTSALGFLNQVHPWLHAERKRYFTVELKGKVLAYLAAIPIPARQGWYLIDTIRRGDSPPGTTELLLLQAMKMLKDQGAREITLGVAPLSSIDEFRKLPVAAPASHRLVYGVLSWIYEKGNAFYNFKPLFLYKMKFRPSEVRPAFLLHRGPGGGRPTLVPYDALSLSQAWLPEGLLQATASGIAKFASRVSIPDLLKTLLRPETIVRSVPPSWGRLLWRCRLTALLIVAGALLNLVMPVRPSWIPLASSSVFVAQVTLLLLYTGVLEYLAGTGLAAVCTLGPWLGVAAVAPAAVFAGPFGAAGGLYWFMRPRRYVLFLAVGGGLAAVFTSGTPWVTGLLEALSVPAGFLLGKRLLRT